MNTRFNHDRLLNIAKYSVIFYFLIFQSWRFYESYPAGVLSENYLPVGVFHILPGPLSNSALDFIFYVWPIFLLGSLIPRCSRLCLFVSFILGCYVLGYAYNFGRVFHGTSLALQILLILAIGSPPYKSSPVEKEKRAQLTLLIGQLAICLAYFASGLAKMLKSGWPWALSENLSIILHTQRSATPLQELLLSMPPLVLQAMALFVFLLELTSILPWFFPGLQLFYVVSWACFHTGVALTLGGHETFFSHLFLYPFFLASFLIRDPQSHGRFRSNMVHLKNVFLCQLPKNLQRGPE